MNAQDYFNRNPERDAFYRIFYQICRRFNVTWSSARCSLNLPFPASPSASNSRSEGLLYSRYTLLTSSTLIANSSIQLQIPLYNTSAKCGRSLLNTVVPRNSSTAVTTQKYTVSPISSQNPI